MSLNVFDYIYKNNIWKEKSGPGSNPENAKEWINIVNLFLEKKEIKTILDIGCGDWRIGQKLNLKNKEYLGIDCSSVIIEEIKIHESDNIKFMCADIETMDIEKTDLILIKDVLQHLPNNIVKIIMDKIMLKSKYILLCNDIGKNENIDILPGQHRNLNLQNAPFSYNLKILSIFKSSDHIKKIDLYEAF